MRFYLDLVLPLRLDDGEKLFRDFGILPGNLVELGAFAARADPAFKLVYRRSIVSLARMVEMYMHKALDKGKVRTGNWENVPLTQEQITCTWTVLLVMRISAYHNVHNRCCE